jgi:hypothetical protein
MIRLSPKYARNRSQAWTEAAWILWQAPVQRDNQVMESYFFSLSMAALWRWLEIALYDQKDRRWIIQAMGVAL